MTCVIEKTTTGYSAYVEEVPGCARAGKTLDEAARLIRQALCVYFENDPDAVPLIFKARYQWFLVESSLPIVAFNAATNAVSAK